MTANIEDRCDSVAGFSDHVYVALALKEHAQVATREPVSVGERDGDYRMSPRRRVRL